MDQRHEQSLLYALDVLGKGHYKKYIRAIYLYGSCARGEQKFSSDVDLFLFLDRDMPDRLIREMRLEVIPHYTLPEVELKISKTEEFSSSYHFNKNIKRDGMLLWERKEEASCGHIPSGFCGTL